MTKLEKITSSFWPCDVAMVNGGLVIPVREVAASSSAVLKSSLPFDRNVTRTPVARLAGTHSISRSASIPGKERIAVE